jgi:hypothetical protein
MAMCWQLATTTDRQNWATAELTQHCPSHATRSVVRGRVSSPVIGSARRRGDGLPTVAGLRHGAGAKVMECGVHLPSQGHERIEEIASRLRPLVSVISPGNERFQVNHSRLLCYRSPFR